MARNVRVNAGRLRYLENIAAGHHSFQVDEPRDMGGEDAGPNPYELLMAALGACTGITVRMFAKRKQWPLQDVHVSLSYAKVHAEDCAKSDTEIRMLDRIDMEISFIGDLSEEQQSRLMEIAARCPVHRTLTEPIWIRQRQVVAHAAVPLPELTKREDHLGRSRTGRSA